MTLAELEHAERCMQQQWHDLVEAEQQGSPLEVLEQMYDTYILLAEEYNRCSEEYQQKCQFRRSFTPKEKKIAKAKSFHEEDESQKLAS